jgi:hypothetical protein
LRSVLRRAPTWTSGAGPRLSRLTQTDTGVSN